MLTARSTRPFLEDIEKKWLAYQLLCAVRDSHARNLFHGDIKTENIIVTSWNWLYLTDFSSTFKKTYLPEDNPADFSFYFDTSGRRTCYLAPERFLSNGEKDDGRGLTWAMDIFSVGCVIAELFVEAPIFSLSQLYKYRRGEFHPKYGYLSKVRDPEIRDLITHMIQPEPESRYSAEEYLNFWRRKAFPEYFYSFLHQYMGLITDPSSGRSPVIPGENFGDADERIDRVYHDFDKISYFLGYESERDLPKDYHGASVHAESLIPLEIDIPNNRHEASSDGRISSDDGSLIFLTLVVSSLRNTARAAARIRALDLMLAFAERITDEAKLDRILPYVVTLLNDRSDMVKVAAVRTMTQLLALVKVVSPVNVNVFSEYIRPRLSHFVNTPSSKIGAPVRATYASCLASLAHSSMQILDTVHALRADGTIPAVDPEAEDGSATGMAYQNAFDLAKVDLLDHFESHTKALLTDPHPSVRRAMLGSVSSLCVFFGADKANDVVLSHLNTYLNDKDWILKCAFFRTVVGVAAFVGGTNFEDFILPLMIQSLTDPEEFVVEQAISSLASIAEIGLVQRSKTWELIDVLARFLVHPNIWIREATAHFVAASTKYLTVAETKCIVAPLVSPYVKFPLKAITELNILNYLKRPLPRSVFDMALVWAGKGQTGLFWKSAQRFKTFSFDSASRTLSTISSKDLLSEALRKVPKNEEDEQWITRLRNIGMSQDDDFKLLALQEYLWRTAAKRVTNEGDPSNARLNGILSLREYKVTPQTIFFEIKKKKDKRKLRTESRSRRTSPNNAVIDGVHHTIADALLDASTNFDDPHAFRRKSHANAAKFRRDDVAHTGTDQDYAKDDASNTASPLSTSPRGRQDSRDLPLARRDRIMTSADSLKADDDDRRTRSIRHKSSAIGLLNRKDTSKTAAEISTSPANAVGKMEGLSRKISSEAVQQAARTEVQRRQSSYSPAPAGHTYDGTDPNVLSLLNSLATENYPADLVDFGPLVTPVTSNRSGDTRQDLRGTDRPWRPEAILLASFGEHTGPINRVIPSPDHVFFITAGADGTIRIWDTMRLERNLAHRSRQTFVHGEGISITSLCFVENSHTFVSAASDGSIKVVKVDYTMVNDVPKYGKLKQVRQSNLRKGEQAVWLEHYKADVHSILLLATNLSRIIALDLRSMKELYALENPVHHGVPTCFCVDKYHGWLLLGTTHGVLSLWDLRFHLRLKAFGLSGGAPLHRLIVHPFRSHFKRVVVAGGTGQAELTVWDLDKSECREVFRASVPKSSGGNIGREHMKAYDVWKVDEEKPEGMLDRFATSVGLGGRVGKTGSSSASDKGIRALAVRLDAPDEKGGSKNGFYLTGGLDCKLRLWDTWRPDASMVISGLDAEEDQPKFSTTQPTTSLIVHSEKIPSNQQSNGLSEVKDPPGSGNSLISKGTKTSVRQPRSTVISSRQKALLRSHLDVITDVCTLERPIKMTVSVDRMGCVYVFQ